MIRNKLGRFVKGHKVPKKWKEIFRQKYTGQIRQRTGKYIECSICSRIFYVKPSKQWRKTCSYVCAIELRKQRGYKVWNKGLTKEIDSRLNYERSTEWKKGETPKGSNVYTKGNIPWTKGRNFPALWLDEFRFKKGKEHPCWRGGITPEGKRRIGTYKWRKLRLKILERDNWICQICMKYGKCVDHIEPWRVSHNDSPENLRCLCRSCNAIRRKEELLKW